MPLKLGNSDVQLYLGSVPIASIVLNGVELVSSVTPPVTTPQPPAGTSFSTYPDGSYLVFPDGEYAVQPAT